MRKVSAVTARSVSGPAKEEGGIKSGGWDTVAGLICPSHGSGGGRLGRGRGCDSPAAGEAVNR